jgi:formate dehydrogenase (coenzyme F420) beta subunit
MSKIGKITVKDRDPVSSLQDFLKLLLEKGTVEAVLVQQRLPMNNSVMPTLVTEVEKLEWADPLAPAFPLNGARMLSRLTRKPLDAPIAAVMRPCEIRAFVELVKLKQGSAENVILISADCLGAYGSTDYAKVSGLGAGTESTLAFHRNVISGKGTATEDADISAACKSCEHPVAENADITIGLLGTNVEESLPLIANTPKGRKLLDDLGLKQEDQSLDARQKAVEALVSERVAYRDQMFERTSAAVSDMEKLMNYLGACVNCYNCRVACPVCYCRECVFTTDVFDHEPAQYLRWAKRKGALKMPTDTVFYHLTRLAHMSAACIGCGQCSNACPNDVPVMELFRTIAHGVQGVFGYSPGASLEEEPPLSVFHEKEFSEVTGGID